MTSKIENITNSILAEAEREASEIRERSLQKREGLLTESKNIAIQESNLIIAKAMSQTDLIIDGIITESKRINRDRVLQAKQNLLNVVFTKAIDRFSNINEATLIKQFEKYIQENKPSTSSIIKIPINTPVFKEKVCSYGFTVQESEQIISGFSIIKDGISKIYDHISIMNFIREDLEPELLEILTGRSESNEKG